MRKKPLQQRSRQMVDTLLLAAAQTIAERGLDGMTTNHVARRAGVSVGSLYQYFEHRDALIEGLLNQVVRELAVRVDQRLSTLMDADVATVAGGLLEVVFDFVQQDACRIELVRNWQRLRGQHAIVLLERHMVEACRQYLLRHQQRIAVADRLPAALFVVISSTIYTSMHYMSLPRPYLKREEVIAAQAQMIAAYLEKPVPARRRSVKT